ncbi:unnamed protein product [Victoria cruziana]
MGPKLGKRRRTKRSTKGKKEQRDRLLKKIRELQALLPNSNKLDMASVLDEAIGYAKSLQCQISEMLMGSLSSTMVPFLAPMAPELHYPLWYPQFEPVGLRVNQGMCLGRGNPSMACNSTARLMIPYPAKVHSSFSTASTLPRSFHGVPPLPVHVIQLRPHLSDLLLGGPGPCGFSSSDTDVSERTRSVHG